ncbi:biosynthesis C-methyltransferase UbiE [Seminavis robusta]|uniref:Biosynthesis C-methyltransferase UbiE n=1 Tax=Seminavis robusta TaxID=568900 RepID=A0A9N8DLA8_9STRA|nr:biosynthesis C-methyltransferase UbiE [Seminavis robusta]|eukprot:Sro217_g089780.1 biosynthesis C-methyltransferase UbiE (219) ;mRNA; r:58056-58712
MDIDNATTTDNSTINTVSETGEAPVWTAETADWYAANFGDSATNRVAVDYLIEQGFLSSCHSMVVDIGCGTGTALRHIAEELQTSKVTLMGVDPTARMLEIAREQTQSMCPTFDFTRFQWRLAGAEGLPLADNSANVVMALDVLDHVHDLGKSLKEIHRILKPDGTLAIGKDGSLGEDSNTELHLQCAREHGLVVHSIRKLAETDDNVAMTVVILKKK